MMFSRNRSECSTIKESLKVRREGEIAYFARRHCPIGPASSRRHPLVASGKHKTSQRSPRRSTVATPPRFHRPTNFRHATKQKEKTHSRHTPHRRFIWD
ncbi:hypothetical protein TNCV_4220201 [Trichonephila clavipes]|nr:hypothetical protein TNCV_4220201 [Trichonephila clavipes]